MTLAKNTSVVREAMLRLFEPRRFMCPAEYADICWSHVKQAVCPAIYSQLTVPEHARPPTQELRRGRATKKHTNLQETYIKWNSAEVRKIMQNDEETTKNIHNKQYQKGTTTWWPWTASPSPPSARAWRSQIRRRGGSLAKLPPYVAIQFLVSLVK